MNTTIIVKTGKLTFDQWKAKYDLGSADRESWCYYDMVGKVDDNTAIITARVFDEKIFSSFMNSKEILEIENKYNLKHTIYKSKLAS